VNSGYSPESASGIQCMPDGRTRGGRLRKAKNSRSRSLRKQKLIHAGVYNSPFRNGRFLSRQSPRRRIPVRPTLHSTRNTLQNRPDSLIHDKDARGTIRTTQYTLLFEALCPSTCPKAHFGACCIILSCPIEWYHVFSSAI
jgi:hypothetical protein